MATILTATTYEDVTGVVKSYTEMPLGGVDLTSRRIPLIHTVEMELNPTGDIVKDAVIKLRIGLAQSSSIVSLSIHDDEVIAAMVLNYFEATGGGAFSNSTPLVRTFSPPVGVSKSSLYMVTQSSNATETFQARLRIFYEVKVVTQSVMLAMLS